MPAKNSVTIVEVSPRDGLQNEDNILSVDDRVKLILLAAKAGARRIEAVSFINPNRVPQMAHAEEVVSLTRSVLAANKLETKLIGLVLNERGFQRALSCSVDEINCVVVASKTFNQRNQNATPDETMRQIESMAGEARKAKIPLSLTIAASFGCPFEGETDPEFVAELAARGKDLGAFEIALADTIGVASPLDITQRFERAIAQAPDVQWRCHFHNTRNTGMANAYAALQVGVTVLDASIGGIGGCPFAPAATGNICTEDLVYMLNRMGIAAGFNIEKLCEITRWLEKKLEKPPPGMVWRAGGFPKARA
mgnify:CR=1 FL=1